jgi:beta-glucanase (GH16 family)
MSRAIRAVRLAVAVIGTVATVSVLWSLASCGSEAPRLAASGPAMPGIASLRAPFDAADPAASGMVPTFADEFDELSASAQGPAEGRRWVDHIWFRGGAGEARESGEALTVDHGVLTIRAWKDGSGWRSGTLQSTDAAGAGFAQRFGYFEARVKVPRGQGLLPAFYLLSNEHVRHGAAPASEFDILEGKGSAPDELYTTLHRDSAHPGDIQNRHNRTRTGVDLSRDFHVYGMLWAPDLDHVAFYLDGKPVMEVAKFDTTDDAPVAIILQLILGTWVGEPDGSTPNPAAMQVDYVRAWQFPGILGNEKALRTAGG